MSGTKEREKGEGCDAGIGVPACAAAVLPKNHLLVAGAKLISAPAAIARLCGREPTQRGDHGVLSFCIAALTLDKAETVGSPAQRIRITSDSGIRYGSRAGLRRSTWRFLLNDRTRCCCRRRFLHAVLREGAFQLSPVAQRWFILALGNQRRELVRLFGRFYLCYQCDGCFGRRFSFNRFRDRSLQLRFRYPLGRRRWSKQGGRSNIGSLSRRPISSRNGAELLDNPNMNGRSAATATSACAVAGDNSDRQGQKCHHQVHEE